MPCPSFGANEPTPKRARALFVDFRRAKSAAAGHVDVCPTIKPKSSYNLKWLRGRVSLIPKKKGVKVIGIVFFFDVTLKNFCEAKALVLFIVAIHNCKISMKSSV